MKHRLLCFFVGSLCIGRNDSPAAEKFELPAENAKLRAGAGAELATAQCLLCHSADYISTQPRLSRVAWTAAVLKMKDKYGAPIQTNTMPMLLDYLVKNYGKEVPK